MAWCPFAAHRPLPENHTQPSIIPVSIIDHSAWDGLTTNTLYHWWDSPGNNLESHFYIQGDGGVEQYMDTEIRADASNKANRFPWGRGWGGAVSIEFWDGAATLGKPQPFTGAQIKTAIALHNWLHDTHPTIQRRVAPVWNQSGVGWHNMHREWAAGGATACPGPPRIDQLAKTIYPATFASTPTPEDTMPANPTKVIAWTKPGSAWAKRWLGTNDNAHAIMVYDDDTSRHLSTSDYELMRFFGVTDLGPQGDVLFDATTLKPRGAFTGL